MQTPAKGPERGCFTLFFRERIIRRRDLIDLRQKGWVSPYENRRYQKPQAPLWDPKNDFQNQKGRGLLTPDIMKPPRQPGGGA